MTKEQLTTLEHVVVRETKDFIHLHTEEGYYIIEDTGRLRDSVTEYRDGTEIKDFCASECYYMPHMEEYPDFRVIDTEEYNRLEAEAEKKREEDEQVHD